MKYRLLDENGLDPKLKRGNEKNPGESCHNSYWERHERQLMVIQREEIINFPLLVKMG